jgi:hypothetical protein
MGMMPSSEVKEERFKVGMNQLVVKIQAGENGCIIYMIVLLNIKTK